MQRWHVHRKLSSGVLEKIKKVKAFIASIAAGSGATVCLDAIRSHIGEVENGILNGLLE